MSEPRVRFAPSPTGFLHLGGARTALFNWLFARHHGGRFILRIEDTDRARSNEESTQQILRDMEWLGLDWDEGPVFQSQRTPLYLAALERLIAAGACYRCDLSPEAVDALREEGRASGCKVLYPSRNREVPDTPGTYVWRFKAPLEGETVFTDAIRGEVRVSNQQVDDLVLCRSDGSPTYNFCVVVDDADLAITHVIRGEDHTSNTIRQVLLYRALDLPTPEFAHLPMIKGLSKRKGSAAVGTYREQGYLPQAVINALARMGWSHGDQEIFSRSELVQHFALEGVGKASGTFNAEKMEWVNAQHIHQAEAAKIFPHLGPFFEAAGIAPEADDPRFVNAVLQLRERSKTLAELAEGMVFYFRPVDPDEKAAKQLRKAPPGVLPAVIEALEGANSWDHDGLEASYRSVAVQLEIGFGKVAQPARAALTGRTASPGLFEVTEALGREESINRLRAAAAKTW